MGFKPEVDKGIATKRHQTGGTASNAEAVRGELVGKAQMMAMALAKSCRVFSATVRSLTSTLIEMEL